MSGVLPEGDPPLVSAAWAHLLREPCSRCGSPRLFAQTLYQRRESHPMGMRLYRTEVLCGDCGNVESRSDPEDRWDRIRDEREGG